MKDDEGGKQLHKAKVTGRRQRQTSDQIAGIPCCLLQCLTSSLTAADLTCDVVKGSKKITHCADIRKFQSHTQQGPGQILHSLIMPKAYTSAALVKRPLRNTSGAMCVTVPRDVVLRCVAPSASCALTPKSQTLATCSSQGQKCYKIKNKRKANSNVHEIKETAKNKGKLA